MWPKDYITYLQWRCRMNWPNHYTKAGTTYMDEWISNVTYDQMMYFINVEREHLIKNGLYRL